MGEMTGLGDRESEAFRTEMMSRIRKGVVWLDTERPDWVNLDVEDLDLNSVTSCVLGQTGGFDNGIYDLTESLGWSEYDDGWDAASEHGFYLNDEDLAILYPMDEEDHYEAGWLERHQAREKDSYEFLTNMWKEVIKEHKDS